MKMQKFDIAGATAVETAGSPALAPGPNPVILGMALMLILLPYLCLRLIFHVALRYTTFLTQAARAVGEEALKARLPR